MSLDNEYINYYSKPILDQNYTKYGGKYRDNDVNPDNVSTISSDKQKKYADQNSNITISPFYKQDFNNININNSKSTLNQNNQKGGYDKFSDYSERLYSFNDKETEDQLAFQDSFSYNDSTNYDYRNNNNKRTNYKQTYDSDYRNNNYVPTNNDYVNNNNNKPNNNNDYGYDEDYDYENNNYYGYDTQTDN